MSDNEKTPNLSHEEIQDVFGITDRQWATIVKRQRGYKRWQLRWYFMIPMRPIQTIKYRIGRFIFRHFEAAKSPAGDGNQHQYTWRNWTIGYSAPDDKYIIHTMKRMK